MLHRAKLNARTVVSAIALSLLFSAGGAMAQTPPQAPNAAAITGPVSGPQQLVSKSPKGAGSRLGFPPLPGQTLPPSPPPSGTQTGLPAGDSAFLAQATRQAMLQTEAGKVEAARGMDLRLRQFAMIAAQNGDRMKADLEGLASRLDASIATLPGPQVLGLEQRMESEDRTLVDRDYGASVAPVSQSETALYAQEARSGTNPMLKNFARKMLPSLEKNNRTLLALSGHASATVASVKAPKPRG